MRDERGLVGRAAITILFLIVVFGLAFNDAGSVLVAKMQTDDTAAAAVTAATSAYTSSHNVDTARQAAIDATLEQDNKARLTGFVVANGRVTVTVRKLAPTLISRHVSFLKKLAVVKSTATQPT